MTKAELLDLLDGVADDTEIRLAFQPFHPFELAIDDTEHEGLPIDPATGIVYLPCGEQLGYLPDVVAETLGWSSWHPAAAIVDSAPADVGALDHPHEHPPVDFCALAQASPATFSVDTDEPAPLSEIIDVNADAGCPLDADDLAALLALDVDAVTPIGMVHVRRVS